MHCKKPSKCQISTLTYLGHDTNFWFYGKLESCHIKSYTPPLWRDLVKTSTSKPEHSSSFSLECTVFKNMIFEKKKPHVTLSEVADVAKVKQPRNSYLWKLYMKTHKNQMKNKIWLQWPRKWPLDLNDLGQGWVKFFGKG